MMILRRLISNSTSLALREIPLFAALLQSGFSATYVISGNLVIPSGTIAPDTYYAEISTGNLIIQSGSILTGDPAWETPVHMAYSSYTIRNSGSLHGASEGILLLESPSTVYNERSGYIAGDSGNGIRMTNDASIYNSGVVISATGNGILGEHQNQIFNGGTISGGLDGITSNGKVVVQNYADGTIIGGPSGTGISGGGDSSIFNSGSIMGSTGIRLTGSPAQDTWVSNEGIIAATNGDAINGKFLVGKLIVSNSGFLRATEDAIEGSLFQNNITLWTGSDVIGDFRLYGDSFLNFFGGQQTADSLVNRVRGDITGADNIGFGGSGFAIVDGRVEANRVYVAGDGGLFLNSDLVGISQQTIPVIINGVAGGTGHWQAMLDLGTEGATEFMGFSAGKTPIQIAANPSEAVGTVEISNQFNVHGRSFIVWDVNPWAPISAGSNSDLIRSSYAGGQFQFSQDSVIRISITNPNRLITEGAYTFVESGSAITGTPGSLAVQVSITTPDTGIQSAAWKQLADLHAAYPLVVSLAVTDTVLSQYFAKTRIDGNEAIIEIDYDFTKLPGLSGKQLKLASAMNRATENPDPESADFIAAIALSDLQTVKDTLNGIGLPVESAMLTYPAAIINTGRRIHTYVQDHLAVTRGDTMISMPVKMSEKSSALPTTPSQGVAWGSFSYDNQQLTGNPLASELDGHTGAFTAGVDYKISPGLILGGLLDGSNSDYNEGPEIKSLRAAVYGSWGSSAGFYSDFLIGFGDHDLDITDAQSLQGLVTLGYTMKNPGIGHGPIAGFEYQYLETGDFTASIVKVEEVTACSFRGLLGYRADISLGRFQPYASLVYSHEFNYDGPKAGATLFGEDLNFQGADQGSAVILSIGTDVILKQNLTFSIGYRGEIPGSDDGAESHGGSFGINHRF